jgi:hypothetical protein
VVKLQSVPQEQPLVEQMQKYSPKLLALKLQRVHLLCECGRQFLSR